MFDSYRNGFNAWQMRRGRWWECPESSFRSRPEERHFLKSLLDRWLNTTNWAWSIRSVDRCSMEREKALQYFAIFYLNNVEALRQSDWIFTSDFMHVTKSNLRHCTVFIWFNNSFYDSLCVPKKKVIKLLIAHQFFAKRLSIGYKNRRSMSSLRLWWSLLFFLSMANLKIGWP